VLLSYILDPFLVDDPSQISHAHTHDWECWQMAATFAARGFDVDVVHFDDSGFVPKKDYQVLVSARTDLERLARHMPDDCLKIAHLDTAHFLTNNAGALERLVTARDRHGCALRNSRMVEENWAIEAADMGCVLGNDFTAQSYRYAGKPIHRIRISSPEVYDWPEDKDFDQVRRSFLWFGSGGLVHKGLDRVLAVFSELSDFHLTVCGPIAQEFRFNKAFQKELYETPNIKTVGWVDVASKTFTEIAARHVGTVYVSASEGGGGSTLTCMHAGLIPIVTEAASVDIGDFGLLCPDAELGTIRSKILEIASMKDDELRRRARDAWRFARENHTREAFAEDYAKFVDEIVLPALTKRGRQGAPQA
jgi:glycosyltransferase involved in cell wall biosynthesis